MSVTKPIKIPRLVGATYSGKGLTSVGKKSSGGTKRGSGGGGKGGSGGSKKSYTPKKKEKIKEDVDRYEKVNTKLEDVENTLSRINKEQGRTKGFDLGDNLDKQTDLLNKQLSITKEKYKIQKKEAEELRGKLSKNFGVKFDGEGFIKNYASTLKKLEGNVNNLISQYNKATTESAQNALEKKIEKAQKRLDNFKELYQRYDTLWGTELRESEEAVEDLKDAIEDLRIEAFKTATQVVDNIKDLNEHMVDFDRALRNVKSLRDDNPFDDLADSTKKLGYYIDDADGSANNFYNNLKKKSADRAKEADKELKAAQQQVKKAKTKEDKRVAQEAVKDAKKKKANAEANKKFYAQMQKDAESGKTGTGYFDMVSHNREVILQQVEQFEKTGKSSIFGENSEALYETAKEILEQSEDAVIEFSEKLLDMKKSLIDAIGEIAEKVSQMSDQFEAVTDNLDYYYDMIQKVNGDEAYDDLNQVIDARVNNRKAQIKMLQDSLDAMKIELKNATDEDVIREIKEDMKEVQDEIHAKTLEQMEDTKTKAENNIQKIVKT